MNPKILTAAAAVAASLALSAKSLPNSFLLVTPSSGWDHPLTGLDDLVKK